MAIEYRIRIDERRVLRHMRNMRDQVPFAISLAINKTAFESRQIVHEEWHRQFADSERRLRKTFPRAVLRVVRRATKRHLAATVQNIAGDEVLRLQIRGGVAHPRRSRSLFVPGTGTPRRSRQGVKLFRAGKYLFRPRKRGRDVFRATLSPYVRVPAKFKLDRATLRIAAAFRRHLPDAVNKAIRTARR